MRATPAGTAKLPYWLGRRTGTRIRAFSWRVASIGDVLLSSDHQRNLACRDTDFSFSFETFLRAWVAVTVVALLVVSIYQLCPWW